MADRKAKAGRGLQSGLTDKEPANLLRSIVTTGVYKRRIGSEVYDSSFPNHWNTLG